eukprot:CAMPEP_0181357402 /NCGR_PEP_ID=MMETSP1106-20121128/4947_1 /TAXON_ID=81844 /ORGANISM="Mantoniella antarctica, Strain SL-175" /LENGTH=123 /DNA_ID=CAMNT_0023470273 /DNA_START=99 /DNA_END=467 /DNA_ORIENTATION=+
MYIQEPKSSATGFGFLGFLASCFLGELARWGPLAPEVEGSGGSGVRWADRCQLAPSMLERPQPPPLLGGGSPSPASDDPHASSGASPPPLPAARSASMEKEVASWPCPPPPPAEPPAESPGPP